jgi:serine/threonine protein phosphatase 1
MREDGVPEPGGEESYHFSRMLHHKAAMKYSSGSSLGRVIAIGDIHGCSTALATLIEAIGPTSEDRVIPLGDVIDYGPDSRGVIRRLRALHDRTQLTLLTGNHEELLFSVLDRQWDLESWTQHGGDQTLASYGIGHPRDLPREDVEFLRTARPHAETDTHALVHANYYPNLPLSETPAAACFWEFLDPAQCWPHYSRKTFVVGHTPQTTGGILDLGFVICIDTDCSRGNWLTALDLGTCDYWQANERAELREGRLHRRTRSHDQEEA